MSGDRWLSGAKEIATYLGVSARGLWRLRAAGAPVLVEAGGRLAAKTSELDAWRRRRCPRDGSPCPR